MTAKEYLMGYLDAAARYDAAQERLEECRRKIAGLKAVTISDMPKAPRDSNRDLSDAFAAMEEAMQKAGKAMARQADIMDDIMDTLEQVRGRWAYTMLRDRYIYGLAWREIRGRYGKSATFCKRHHSTGLLAVQRILDERTKKDQ